MIPGKRLSNHLDTCGKVRSRKPLHCSSRTTELHCKTLTKQASVNRYHDSKHWDVNCLCGWFHNVIVNNLAILQTVPRLTSDNFTCRHTETERGDHEFCLSRSHYSDSTKPIGSRRPHRKSNSGPPHQESLTELPCRGNRWDFNQCS